MRSSVFAFVLFAACALAPPRSHADDTPAAAPNPEQGRSLFKQFCAQCHGVDLQPIPGVPDLKAFAGTEEDMQAIVTEGRGMMPPVYLSGEEIAAIYAYIRSAASNTP